MKQNNKKIKRKIGVDLDEVLFNLKFSYFTDHNFQYGTKINPSFIGSYDFSKIVQESPSTTIEKILTFYQTTSFLHSPIVMGSQTVLRILSPDSEFFAITSRPESIRDITQRQLHYHYSFLFSEVFFTNELSHFNNNTKKSKADICKDKNIDIMIEDNLEIAQVCAMQGVRVYLLDAPWNKGSINSNIHRVSSWYDLLENIRGER